MTPVVVAADAAAAAAAAGGTEYVVSWAILGIIGGGFGIGILVAGWMLQSHLALIREFDAFKGEVRSTYATTPAVKEAVADALAPIVRDIEAGARASERQGRMLEAIALRMHIPAATYDP